MSRLLKSSLGQFRIVSFAEGVSYVLLLFIAMPLKYMAGMPMAVSVVGSLHGFLFVVFIAALLRAAMDCNWRITRVLVAFIASVIPFGAFWLERSLKREMDAAESLAAGKDA